MTNRNTLKPLIATSTRIATALAVTAFVGAAWMGTEHESHRAVQMATTTITGPLYVTLPAVEIVGQRVKAGDAVATSGASHEAL
jgi:hypothetical protein